jgi:hypothetical protein
VTAVTAFADFRLFFHFRISGHLLLPIIGSAQPLSAADTSKGEDGFKLRRDNIILYKADWY